MLVCAFVYMGLHACIYVCTCVRVFVCAPSRARTCVWIIGQSVDLPQDAITATSVQDEVRYEAAPPRCDAQGTATQSQ